MEIKEAAELKEELEDNIRDLINAYLEKTNLLFSDIIVVPSFFDWGTITKVRIDVNLMPDYLLEDRLSRGQ